MMSYGFVGRVSARHPHPVGLKPDPRPRPTCRGFTLLELLVALAIFALVAALAYGGLHTVLDTRAQLDQEAERLRAVQTALQLLGRDLAQLAERGIRDEYGDAQPALLGADEGARLELTRGGWPNPASLPRSRLQRVAYGVTPARTLVRAAWPVLDRAQDSRPAEQPLLEGVRSLRLRFLDRERQWQEHWPPTTTQPLPATADPRPLAVEVLLELDDWGPLRRVFVLAGGGP